MDLTRAVSVAARYGELRHSPSNDLRHGTESHHDVSRSVTFKCAEVLKALSDAKRRRIARALLAKPQSVNDLSESLNIEQSNVSKNLSILRIAGIVEFSQIGCVRMYRISEAVLAGAEGERNVLEFGCCRIRFDQIFD